MSISNTTFMIDIDLLKTDSTSASNKSITTRLSKNIASRRRELCMTQAQLAEKLGVEPETLSRFERGKNLPSLSTLEKLADLLLISVADLLAEQPQTPDDDALIFTSWISDLTVADRAFVHTILKQCCDYLGQKSRANQSSE